MSEQPPPIPSVGLVSRPKTAGLAIASLVLGILGITCLLPLIGAILALIFGIVALVKIRNSGGRLKGEGQAIAGLVLGGVGMLLIPLLAGLMLPALAQAREAARRANCTSNLKQIGLAMALYADQHDNTIPRTFEDLRTYVPNLEKLLICPSANDPTRPSYQIVAGGQAWGTDKVVVTEPLADHRRGRNFLYGDGHVEFHSER